MGEAGGQSGGGDDYVRKREIKEQKTIKGFKRLTVDQWLSSDID